MPLKGTVQTLRSTSRGGGGGGKQSVTALSLFHFSCHLTPIMSDERTHVYLFWDKEWSTACREVLFSGETITTSLYWDSTRNHFSVTERIATGIHSGMLIGDDFESLRVESFQVLPSATCLSIQLRSEVPHVPHDTSSRLPALPPQQFLFSPPSGDTVCPSDTSHKKEGSVGDYYDHLIEEHYKNPRDLLSDNIYQIPSNIPVDTPVATVAKTPLFIPRHQTRCQATQESKNSAPTDSQVPVAAPRPPRKVREGLDIQVRIPSHYDTCSHHSTALLKQLSECGTGATQSGSLSPLLRDSERNPSPADPPTSPLATQRHSMLKRPPISITVHRYGSVSKECGTGSEHSPLSPVSSLPIPVTRLTSVTSPLATVHIPRIVTNSPPIIANSPPKLSHSPPKLSHSSPEVFEERGVDCAPLFPVLESTGDREESSRMQIELSELRVLKIELGREVSERERLEEEVSSGRKECDHLRRAFEEVSTELTTNLRLLEEERKCSEMLRCQVSILKTAKHLEKAPKLLKPKPILPKPTRKV